MTLFENEPALTGHQFKIRGGKLWTLDQAYYDELKDTYPLKDVEGEIRKAKLWCRNISASRRKTAVGMHKFLNGWVNRAESTGHVTVDPEKSPSEVIRCKNIEDAIELYANVIDERRVGLLRSDKMFMGYSRAYPEFAAWALDRRPDLKGAKADPVKVDPVKKVEKPKPAPKKVEIIADLPPPNKKEKAVKLYQDVILYKNSEKCKLI